MKKPAAKDTSIPIQHGIPALTMPDPAQFAKYAKAMTPEQAFDLYKAVPLGVMGNLTLPREELVRRVEQRLGSPARLIPGGPDVTRRVGIITGGAGGRIGAAAAAGCDTFITGEGAHYTYFDAMELGLNVNYAGHYATETVGVQALAAHLSARFGLPWVFHDHPTGL